MKKSLLLFIIIFSAIFRLLAENNYKFNFNSFRGATTTENFFEFRKKIHTFNIKYSGNLKKYQENQFYRKDNYSKNSLTIFSSNEKIPALILKFQSSKIHNSSQKYERFQRNSFGLKHSILKKKDILFENKLTYFHKIENDSLRNGFSTNSLLNYNKNIDNFNLDLSSNLKIKKLDNENNKSIINNLNFNQNNSNSEIGFSAFYRDIDNQIYSPLYSDSLNHQKINDLFVKLNYKIETFDWLILALEEKFSRKTKEYKYHLSKKYSHFYSNEILFNSLFYYKKISLNISGGRGFNKDKKIKSNQTKKIENTFTFHFTENDSIQAIQKASIEQKNDLSADISSNDKYKEYWQLSLFLQNDIIKFRNHFIYQFIHTVYLDKKYSSENERKELFQINPNVIFYLSDNIAFHQLYSLIADYTRFDWNSYPDRLFRNVHLEYKISLSDRNLRNLEIYNNFHKISFLYKLDLSDNGILHDDLYEKNKENSKINSIGLIYNFGFEKFYMSFNPNLNFYNTLIEKEYFSQFSYLINQKSKIHIKFSGRGNELHNLIYKADFNFKYFF